MNAIFASTDSVEGGEDEEPKEVGAVEGRSMAANLDDEKMGNADHIEVSSKL